MNKHQRKRSKRIKKWMNILNAKGYNVTYKQTKLRMRTLDRAFNKWVRIVWPKENPFMVRYLGRWYYKKEENNAE